MSAKVLDPPQPGKWILRDGYHFFVREGVGGPNIQPPAPEVQSQVPPAVKYASDQRVIGTDAPPRLSGAIPPDPFHREKEQISPTFDYKTMATFITNLYSRRVDNTASPQELQFYTRAFKLYYGWEMGEYYLTTFDQIPYKDALPLRPFIWKEGEDHFLKFAEAVLFNVEAILLTGYHADDDSLGYEISRLEYLRNRLDFDYRRNTISSDYYEWYRHWFDAIGDLDGITLETLRQAVENKTLHIQPFEGSTSSPPPVTHSMDGTKGGILARILEDSSPEQEPYLTYFYYHKLFPDRVDETLGIKATIKSPLRAFLGSRTAQRQELAEGVRLFNRIVDTTLYGLDGKKAVFSFDPNVNRAYFHEGVVYFSPNITKYVVVHFLAHWMESQVADLKIWATKFLAARMNVEGMYPLADIYDDPAYGPNEWTLWETFADPYMGKTGETNATALEHISHPSFFYRLVRDDPEFAAYGYNLARGCFL